MPTTTPTPDVPRTAENGGIAHGPSGPRPPTDQEKFDAEVDRNGATLLKALGAFGILAALIMSTIALVVATQSNSGAMMVMPATPAAAAPVVPAAQSVSLSVAGSIKKGPDGKMHDAFSTTNFAVKVGQPTRLVINNKDASPHSITAAATGVSITVYPGIHTYTIMATRAGRFEWVCVIPCDSDAHGWAMTHPGYMAGYITAT